MSVPPPIPPRPPGFQATPLPNPPLPPRNRSSPYSYSYTSSSSSPPPNSSASQQQSRSTPYSYCYTPPTPQLIASASQQQQPQQRSSPYNYSHTSSTPQPNASASQQQQQQQQQQRSSPYNYSHTTSAPQPNTSNSQQQNAPPGFGPPPTEPAPPPSKWTEHLYYSNGRPTPVLEALMKEFFTRIDRQNTGYITPEQYTSFLDACQWTVEHQLWKTNLKGNMMYKAEDMADFELKAVLEGFFIDHKVVVRNAAHNQLPCGGMPLLSLAGFTDLMAMEFAAEPDRCIGGLNNALRQYGIWPERGPIPRYLLPVTCPHEVKRRLDEAKLRCRSKADELLDATQARMLMEKKGREYALDLISGPQYVYYY